MGKAGSGRFVTVTWIEIFRMESGKAVEGWVESDTTALIDQLNPRTPVPISRGEQLGVTVVQVAALHVCLILVSALRKFPIR
jgi:hypothetical protein